MNKIDYSDTAKDILYTLVAVGVIPGLIFWLVGQFWFIDRAILNIDYLLVCLALAPFGAVTVVAGMASILIIDIIFSFAPAYHFSLASVLLSISDVFSLAPGFLVVEFLKIISIVLLGAVFMFLSVRRTRRKGIVMLTCLVSAILLTVLDMTLSANAIRERDSYALNVNITASSLNNLRLAINTAEDHAQNQYLQPAESAGQVLRNLQESTDEEFQTVILIVVESLGEFFNSELQNFQMEPVIELQKQEGIVLSTGVIPFAGSTVPGELRELCGIKLLAVHPDISILPGEKCLPLIFEEMGYSTWAIHGFIGTLFSRNRWYPALEFDNVWFAPELENQIEEANRCGIAFHGICDVDIWKMILDLKSSEHDAKKFIYWLTLSAHLPVENSGDSSLRACSNFKELAENPELCNLVLQQRRLLSDIATSIGRGELNKTRVVLVGDHSPPFIDKDIRSLFSSDLVPYADIKISSDM